MTGYGKHEISKNDIHIEVEIKSGNNRFFEPRIYLPKEYMQFEQDIRSKLNDSIKRGFVECRINVSDNKTAHIEIDEQRLLSYWAIYEKAKKRVKTEAELPLYKIVTDHNLIQIIKHEERNDQIKRIILDTVDNALLDIDKASTSEGEKMKLFFLSSIEKISSSLSRIESLYPSYKEQQIKKIKQSIEEVTLNKMSDDRLDGIISELTLYIDKANITEEIERLYAHIGMFKSKSEQEECGKSLNFILQEMHREINTIGSKFGSSEAFEHIIIIKEEIEKCREMVQNVR
jgi:uncharacterized protein (TIGR00255 family)